MSPQEQKHMNHILDLQYNYGAFGTLVIYIPTSEGIILAADSRVTNKGKHYDYLNKIHTIERLPRFAYTNTGIASVYPEPPPDVTTEWFIQTEPLYDAARIVEKVFKEQKPINLSNQFISILASRLRNSIRDQPSQYERELYRTILVHFDPETRLATIANFAIKILPSGMAITSDTSINTHQPSDRTTYSAYGESEYLNTQVFNGKGRKYLPSDYDSIMQSVRTISELSAHYGAYLAYSMIYAASKMTEFIPANYGIGGPINMFLIDGINTPRKYNLDLRKSGL